MCQSKIWSDYSYPALLYGFCLLKCSAHLLLDPGLFSGIRSCLLKDNLPLTKAATKSPRFILTTVVRTEVSHFFICLPLNECEKFLCPLINILHFFLESHESYIGIVFDKRQKVPRTVHPLCPQCTADISGTSCTRFLSVLVILIFLDERFFILLQSNSMHHVEFSMFELIGTYLPPLGRILHRISSLPLCPMDGSTVPQLCCLAY